MYREQLTPVHFFLWMKACGIIRRMNANFSRRIEHVPSSFLREIFNLLDDPNLISFAAGLPNPNLFPTEAFARAAADTLRENAGGALQYGATEGLRELREIIAHSYKAKDNIDVDPDEVLVTNGSQQGLDLLGKVLVNEGDVVATENPTYLAAIQAFSFFQPTFVGVHLADDGLDSTALAHATAGEHPPKLLYTIPNFQNPTGITYTDAARKRVVDVLHNTATVLIEDDPYGEIRFEGVRRTPFAKYTDQAVLLGSFSKIVAPGLRLGWIVARNKVLYDRLKIAKQASDLHSSTFSQHVMYRYYRDNDTQAHVDTIARHYKHQKDTMVASLRTHIPTVSYTNPEGGMFLWATVSKTIDTGKLFPKAIQEGVAFVPGESFFCGEKPKNTMRLNYTNATPEQIEEGVRRLARAIKNYED